MGAHSTTPSLSPEVIRLELQEVLASPDFTTSKRLSDFLRFVVEETLQGRSDRIKERTVALKALGRDESYDARHDPVVRVVAGRLRRALERYYAGVGADHTVRIEIPKGQYQPTFASSTPATHAEERDAPVSQLTPPEAPAAAESFDEKYGKKTAQPYVTYGMTALLVGGLLPLLWFLWPENDNSLTNLPSHSAQPPQVGSFSMIEQSGALPYRVRDDSLEVMLVRTRRDSHWTIPKATQSPYATAQQTAADEAFQEAGVHGTAATAAAGAYSYNRKGKWYRVTVYPVLVEEESNSWPEMSRERRWCTAAEAVDFIASIELSAIVARFDAELP